MASLDGYSLNEKMDKNFEDINERIEAVHYRIEREIESIKVQFKELTKASSKASSKKKEKKNAVSESM